MKDSVAHGIAWRVDKKDSLIPVSYPEAFFLFDERVLDKVPVYSDDFIGYEVFYYLDTTEVIAGTWYYNTKTHEPIQKKCAYFHIDAPDTINYGEPYQMVITAILGLVEDFEIRLELGDMKFEEGYFIIHPIREFNGSNKGLHIEIDYEKGINLLTGRISFHSELLDNDLDFLGPWERNSLIFYHQFYVE